MEILLLVNAKSESTELCISNESFLNDYNCYVSLEEGGLRSGKCFSTLGSISFWACSNFPKVWPGYSVSNLSLSSTVVISLPDAHLLKSQDCWTAQLVEPV